jgi:poly(hydroxyalkanoate) granule-associated protein
MATEEDQTPQAEIPVPGESSAGDATDAAIVQCANLFLSIRRLLFMSLGALALTADEARDFVDRLGERGDIAQARDLSHGLAQSIVHEEVERWVDDLHQQHPSPPPSVPAEINHNGNDGRVDALWGRLRVPTRREIESLSRKINDLDAKLAALHAKRTPDSPPASADPATQSER